MGPRVHSVNPSEASDGKGVFPLLRVGVIAAGQHATENLLPTLRLLPGVRITSLSSRSPENLDRLATLYQVPHKTRDWRELINSDLVDAVVVSATPEVHEQVLLYNVPLG